MDREDLCLILFYILKMKLLIIKFILSQKDNIWKLMMLGSKRILYEINGSDIEVIGEK